MMNNKTLTVLISTYNERLVNLSQVINIQHPNVRYIVVHQVNGHENYTDIVSKITHERNDIQYIKSATSGVTKSRNIALELVNTDYGLFMDDDVKLVDDFYDIIINGFLTAPESSVITFQAADIENGELLKNYLAHEQRHNKLSILKVGTIEVAFDVQAVKQSRASFPEYLGAGTALPACDEPVFLARVMNSGGLVTFVPKVIVYHPKLSSGKEFVTENSLICRGVAFKDIFGKLVAVPMLTLFYLKNRKKFKLAKKSAFVALFKGYFKTNLS